MASDKVGGGPDSLSSSRGRSHSPSRAVSLLAEVQRDEERQRREEAAGRASSGGEAEVEDAEASARGRGRREKRRGRSPGEPRPTVFLLALVPPSRSTLVPPLRSCFSSRMCPPSPSPSPRPYPNPSAGGRSQNGRSQNGRSQSAPRGDGHGTDTPPLPEPPAERALGDTPRSRRPSSNASEGGGGSGAGGGGGAGYTTPGRAGGGRMADQGDLPPPLRPEEAEAIQQVPTRVLPAAYPIPTHLVALRVALI